MVSSISLADGVVIERVGSDLIALVPNSSVVKLAGPAEKIISRLRSGEKVSVDEDAVAELIEAGVLQSSDAKGISRRNVVKLAAVAGGTGVTALALPTVAAASSVVALTGNWYWYDEHDIDQARGGDQGYVNPTWTRDFVVDLGDSFSMPSGDPSPLSALGQDVPFQFGDQEEVTFFIEATAGETRDKSEPLTGTITGTFTWGAVTYQVTFTQSEDANSISVG